MNNLNFLSKSQVITNDSILSEIESLDQSSFPWPWADGEIKTFLLKPESYICAGIDSSGELVSFVLGSLDRYLGQFHLYKIITGVHAQGRGYSWLLMGRCSSDLVDLGMSSIYLEVSESNKSAIALYKKLQLEIIHSKKSFYSNGDTAYMMQGEVNLNIFD